MNSQPFPVQAEGESGEKPLAYVKAFPLKEYGDLEKIKDELRLGNVLIVKLTPLAVRSIEAVKDAIEELKAFVEAIGGDIARLGEERIVLTPPTIRIWRKKA